MIIDILKLDGKNTLHAVDEATAYQSGRFLSDMSARSVWNAFRACWIDVYLGPPDFVAHDAGTNLVSTEFRQNAKSMGIQIHEAPVEAHHSIGKVERYHVPLRRAYDIICIELKGQEVSAEEKLQMALKALNDSIGPHGLIPTLLVYGAYPRMTIDSAPSSSIEVRAKAVKMAMQEIEKIRVKRSINNALNTRNGPNTLAVLNLPLQSEVIVWRENKGWKGPYKIVAIDVDHQECVIEMPYGPTKFRATVVKPFLREEEETSADFTRNEDTKFDSSSDSDKLDNDEYTPPDDLDLPKRRLRGRPKGSKNRSTKFPEVLFEELTEGDCTTSFDSECETFISAKEEADLKISLKLRKEGVINTPGEPFEAADRTEFNSLLERGVIKLEKYNRIKHGDGRLFNSRFVREIKGKGTNSLYEKTRMVIAAWGDQDKNEILTQSPTLQRASQRLIAAIAPSLFMFKNRKIGIWLRDISQAYTQSTSLLNRLICARIPKELRDSYPEGTIMVILKPLYGIPESGTHWWVTYMDHHLKELQMEPSTYDPCLLITKNEVFGLVGMQTDDTFILGEEKFSKTEEEKLKFTAKPKESLTISNPLMFNGCIFSLNKDGEIYLCQKGQAKKIELVDVNDSKELDTKKMYVQQRARGAYVASICQPEACFDLSTAAQIQEPIEKDIERLNKRLKWQMTNQDRGLKFIPLDLRKANLYVFVDGSFANNRDLSSQIGFIIVLANEIMEEFKFTLKGNIIHYSSTKSKRVTRSVLASEIYGMVGGVDMAYALSTTLKMITNKLKLPEIRTMVCTDSYSLYECLVKLGTTKEKRLMIDLMALRQSYERRELYEVRWINGVDNPADSMTKSNPNNALETLIDKNEIEVRIEGWVKRD